MYHLKIIWTSTHLTPPQKKLNESSHFLKAKIPKAPLRLEATEMLLASLLDFRGNFSAEPAVMRDDKHDIKTQSLKHLRTLGCKMFHDTHTQHKKD